MAGTASQSPARGSKRVARRLLAVGENRLDLLLLELQEERARLIRALWLCLGVSAFGLLAWLTLSAAVVVLFWETWRLAALLILTLVNATVALLLHRRLLHLRRNWVTLSATIDQLRKDRASLESLLS